MKKKAIFFDRDGIVNYRIVGEYVKEIQEFNFIPDFFDFFEKIKSMGYLAILISNQQGVGKGLMSEDDLAFLNEYMQNELFKRLGTKFDATYYCTALAGEDSPRRKPEPGMLLEAIDEFGIAPAESFMLGDSENDIIAGKKAGVKTVLIVPVFYAEKSEADMRCRNLYEIEI